MEFIYGLIYVYMYYLVAKNIHKVQDKIKDNK